MGPHCAGIFDPRDWGKITDSVTLEFMRIVLATGLFAIGVELPRNYMWKHAKGLLVMVVPTMAIGWVIVAGAPPRTGVKPRLMCCLFSHIARLVPSFRLRLQSCYCSLSDADRPYHIRCHSWCVSSLQRYVRSLIICQAASLP